jgi:hypothetical protein
MGMLKDGRATSEEDTAEPEGTAVPPEEASAAPEAEEAGDEEGSGWPEHLPEDQQDAFESAVTMLYDVLYKNPQTSKAVLDQVIADEDPQIRVESVARASVLLVQQVDAKLNLPEEIIPYFIATVVDRLIELAEKVKKAAFDDNDTLAALAATAEGVRALFAPEQGADPAAPQPPAEAAPAAAPAPGAPA